MLAMVRRLRSTKWETLPLLIPDCLRGMRSIDPRDKLFALLGFVALDSPFLKPIAPDYGKSTEQVYLYFVRYVVLDSYRTDT